MELVYYPRLKLIEFINNYLIELYSDLIVRVPRILIFK